MSGISDQVVIGAASKGIIQRQHQHNAQVYKQLYQPNPFANETDEDLENYKREITRKQKHVLVQGASIGKKIFYSTLSNLIIIGFL